MGDTNEQKPANFFRSDSDRNMSSERSSRPLDHSPSTSFYAENRALSHNDDSRSYLISSQPNPKLINQLPFEIAAGAKDGIQGMGHYELESESLRTQSPFSVVESHDNCKHAY